MKYQVLIPQFLHNEFIRNYIPQTIKIQKGDTIRWINTDSESHHLFFIKIDPDPTNLEVLNENLCLNSGEVGDIIFNYNYERIDYVCKIHRREVNSITIFTADDYKNINNTQRLRYLNKRYNIRHHHLLSFLDKNK